MSVFRGSVVEYPGVIIDHFVAHNCGVGRAFFLSHCHRDHMSGLGSPNIVQALRARQTSFHCSEVTQALLLKDPEFTKLVPYLKSLPMEEPIAMTMEALGDLSPLSFTVTLLPAGHCPGSVMFFFQGPGGNVLYTGDFRLTLEETKRLRPLHTRQGLMEIASLYLDTTFCHPIATTIPSRETSSDKVIEVMERWLRRDEGNVVRLHCGTFGYEHILMGVARRFKCKVHIARWKMAAYSEMPAVAECLTGDGDSTRIHCCLFRKGDSKYGKGRLPCGSSPVVGTMNVLHIKPSTLWFLSIAKSLKEPLVFLPKFNSYRVIHSMHASYQELRQFLSYVKPRRVVPCVLPVGDASFSSLHVRLKALLPEADIDSSACTSGGGGGGDGAVFKLKKSRTPNVKEERHPTPEPTERELSPLVEGNSRSAVSLSKEPESFLLPSASTPVSRLPLPSLLEVGGGVIAPPKMVGHCCQVLGSMESLEQTPLDLDSSGDSSCQSMPGKDLEAPKPSPVKSQRTPETQESSLPLSKKPRLSCKEETKAPIEMHSTKKRNLTRAFSHHQDSKATTTIANKSPLNPNPSYQHSYNDHHHACILFNDHPPHTESGSSQEKEWEESEGSQSPSILPLTPGKEEVNSILHRRNLTLF